METNKITLNSDPRIDSPHIKVVYPIEEKLRPKDPLPPTNKTLVENTATNSIATTTVQASTVKPLSLKDAFMLHKGTFALVGLGCVMLGYFIAKKL